MEDQEHEPQEALSRNGHAKAVFGGVLLGGVAGAITALLLAPQSGRETRDKIQSKVVDMRHRTSEKVDDTVEQIRSKAGQIKSEVGSKARNLKQQGRDALVEQLDRVSAAAEASKKEIQGNRT